MKVLALPRYNAEEPVLIKEPVPVPELITPVILRPFAESPLTEMVRVPPLRSTALEIVGVVEKLSLVAEMPEVSVKVPVPMVGVELPPELLKVIEPKVFVPENRVTVAPPLSVRFAVGFI